MKYKELDLHEEKHKDVPRKVDMFIGEHLMSGSREVFIITGNSEPMKKIVKKTLSDYQIVPEEDPLNSGVMVVSLQ